MQGLLTRLLIYLKNKFAGVISLIAFIFVIIYSCHDKRNENFQKLSDLFVSKQLTTDVLHFMKLNDSIDAKQLKERAGNKSRNHVYACCFFKCNGSHILTIDLLSFYNKILPPGEYYLGYYKISDRYFVFYHEESAISLVNSNVLIKKYPDSIGDEYSKEALLTNNGGDCRSLVYRILPDSEIVLLKQNPMNYIRLLDKDTNIFPCDDL